MALGAVVGCAAKWIGAGGRDDDSGTGPQPEGEDAPGKLRGAPGAGAEAGGDGLRPRGPREGPAAFGDGFAGVWPRDGYAA